MEGSARSSHLFDARLPHPYSHHHATPLAHGGGPRTFRRLQPDLLPVRQERSRLQATLDHRDDDPRLMMGAHANAGASMPQTAACHASCSSTSLSQRLRRAVINDDLPTARRLAQRAIAELAAATTGAATVAGRSSASSSSRGAIIRNITSPRPTSPRRVPHYPRGSIESETHLSHLSSLELAIMYGCSLGLVEWLLDMGHEEEGEGGWGWTRDEWGRSVPHLAAIAGRADIVATYCSRFDARDVADLLDTAGDVTPSPTPLLSTTPNLNSVASLPTHGRTPLHDAAMRGYDAVVLVLLSRGSDPRRLDGYGNTALHYASSFGHLTTLQILMDAAAAARGGDTRQDDGEDARGGSDEENDSDDEVVGGSSSVSSALFGIKNDGGFSAADYAFTMSDRAALEALGRKWFADSRERERRKKLQAAERAAMKEKATAVAGVVGEQGQQQQRGPLAIATAAATTTSNSTTTASSTRPTRRASTLERLKSGAKDVVSGAVVAIASSSPRSPRASSPRPPTSPTPTPRATSPRAAGVAAGSGSSSSPPGSPSRRGSLAAAAAAGGGTTMGMHQHQHPRLAAVGGPPVGFTPRDGE